jgi:hypothetical protein
MYAIGILFAEESKSKKATKYILMYLENKSYVVRSRIRTIEELYRTNKDIIGLIKIYRKLNDNKLINQLEKYLKSSDNSIDIEIIKILNNTNLDQYMNVPKYLYVIKDLVKKQINLLEQHFKYTIGGSGFIEAHNDFLSLLNH